MPSSLGPTDEGFLAEARNRLLGSTLLGHAAMPKIPTSPLLSPLLGLLLACSQAPETPESEATTQSSGATTETSTSGAQSSDSTSDSTGDSTGAETEATATTEATGADGEACIADDDCISQLCLKYRDHDPQATCASAPDEGRFRLTGTILDFGTGAPIGEVEVRALDGLTALQNPDGAPVLLAAQADSEGRVDTVSEEPIAPGIGLVGLVVGAGLTPTSNVLAVPLPNGPYGRTNTFHDLWVAQTPLLEGWSALLQTDPEAAPHLPLGVAGGVVGIVRERATGSTVAGAVVTPLEPPSGAVIRYLNAARDGFQGEATAEHGLFVLLHPGVGERFVVEVDGMALASAQGQARDAPGSISTLVLEVP